MDKESLKRRREDNERFTVEDFTEKLIYLREELVEVDPSFGSDALFWSITDEDFIDIYANWCLHSKSWNPIDQNGFIFEILSRRFLLSIDRPSQVEKNLKSIILFLNESDNNARLWGNDRSNPDDISLHLTGSSVRINKIYESKISTQSAKAGKPQRVNTRTALKDLVSALNGNESQISTKRGLKILRSVRENIKKLTPFPIEVAFDCEYVYVLPSDQSYVLSSGKFGRQQERHVSAINVPITVDRIEVFREITMSFFGDYYGDYV